MTQPRAISAEDKALRLEAILDAAERLWLARPGIMPSMAEIAADAGLAKGTLYLYFRSKETLFLALHERHLRWFFGRVAARAATPAPMDIEDMLDVLRRFLGDTPAFLPLASLIHGLLERHVPLEVGFEFEQRTQAGLLAAVDSLRPHFPQVSLGLMLQSYGLILGLWQLMRPSPLKALMQERELYCVCTLDYLNMLETALRALWRGALSTETPA
ncbi:MAG: TetR family transcriptional regulator [Pseudomonadota bacterium]